MISFLKTGQNTAVLYGGLIESHKFHKMRLLIACFSRLFYKQKRLVLLQKKVPDSINSNVYQSYKLYIPELKYSF